MFEEEEFRDLDEDWDEDEEEESEQGAEQASFVCEDCDYRWEELTSADFESDSLICPMCGSTNVTQL